METGPNYSNFTLRNELGKSIYHKFKTFLSPELLTQFT
jgi:hypothetical protein